MTGFEPFGGDARNPSWDAVQALAQGFTESMWQVGATGRKPAPKVALFTQLLPVSFSRGPAALLDSLRDIRPAVVVATGYAAKASEIRLERVALNLADARIHDNDGAEPRDAAVIDGAPAAYFAKLPLRAAEFALRRAQIPVTLSETAGTFVCNAAFFTLMHQYAKKRDDDVSAGFVHVPPPLMLGESYAEGILTIASALAEVVRAALRFN